MYNKLFIYYIQHNYLMLIAGDISSDKEAKEIDFIAKVLIVKKIVHRMTSQK